MAVSLCHASTDITIHDQLVMFNDNDRVEKGVYGCRFRGAENQKLPKAVPQTLISVSRIFL